MRCLSWYTEGLSQSVTYAQRNMLFVGDDKGKFTNLAEGAGESFRRMRVSRGAAFGDYDNDGDIDILMVNSGGKGELLRNDLPKNDRWLKVRVRGNAPNTHAIGAKVNLIQGERRVATEVRFASTYLSGSDPTLHFGLKPGDAPLTIEVTWPSGQKLSVKCNPGELVRINEPTPEPAPKPAKEK